MTRVPLFLISMGHAFTCRYLFVTCRPSVCHPLPPADEDGSIIYICDLMNVIADEDEDGSIIYICDLLNVITDEDGDGSIIIYL